MSVRQSLLFLSLAALAVSGTASAQDRDQTFRERDRNNDGALTQGEYGGHPGNFRSLDTNGDGVLSYEEFVRRHGRDDSPTLADPFAVMDRNNDHLVALKEWTGPIREFREWDANDNGVLTRAEFDNKGAVEDDLLVMRRRFGGLDRDDDWRLSRSEARMGSPSEFNRADSNRNGYLSMAEYITWTRRYAATDFDVLDRNRDGKVTYAEWQSEHRDERVVFTRVDRDNDGVLTRAEFDNRPVVLGGPYGGRLDDFRALDRNDDGVLTRNESRLSTPEFDGADVDNDGVLTLKEYANAADNDQFDVLDRNNDGMVSRWEWNGNRDDFDRMDRNGDAVLSRSEFDRRSSGGFLGSILGRVEDVRFNDLDLNNDGVLTSSEWRGSMSEFDRLDRNDDRVVSLSEYTY